MNIDDAIRDIEAIASWDGLGLSEEQLLEVGYKAIEIVVDRTQAGVDVNHKPFEKYSTEYAAAREKKGLSGETVNLDLQGHMQAAMIPIVDGKSVSVGFLSEFEAQKAQWHAQGVDKNVGVKPHTRVAYVDAKTGKRVSRQEAAKDKRRKNKRVAERSERVEAHQRHQRLPKRDFLGIRHLDDERKLGEVIAAKYVENLKARR